MSVPASGPCLGTVGGGSLEHSVINAAMKMLKDGHGVPVLRTFLHREDAEPGAASGMICSGEQDILLIPSPPLNRPSEAARGIRVTPAGLCFTDTPPEEEGLRKYDEGFEYTETLKPPPVVYIFGGGHCSRALTPVLNSLGMRVVVVDDRENVRTMEENGDAWKKIRMDYTQAGPLVPDDGESLVVIMTASHRGDAVVLEQMLPKNLKYLGMMASRTTAEHVMGQMRRKGFSRESLSAVRSPVGIPISSHTPAEIAVSIAAEIIKVMNG